jgi:TolA-binding protein
MIDTRVKYISFLKSAFRHSWFGFLAGLIFIGFMREPAQAAELAETEQFAAAVKAFQDGFYERAEKELSDFLKRFRTSTNRVDATLFRGESLLKLKRYDAALDLLLKGLPTAAGKSDEFIFWIAESQFGKGEFESASSTYARLLHDYPQSPRVLEASIGGALAEFKLKRPAKTVEILRSPSGAFVNAAAHSTNSAAIAKGQMLLADALLQSNDHSGAREALAQLDKFSLPLDLNWERANLACAIEMNAGQLTDALRAATNLVDISLKLGRPATLVASYNLLAHVYELLGKTNSAVESYDKIVTTPNLPPESKHQAISRAADLLVSVQQFTNATERLEGFLKEYSQDPAADQLRLQLGETWLNQFQVSRANGQIATNATNLLWQARLHFDFVINQMTNTTRAGKALLDRGWTFWEEARITSRPGVLGDAAASFQAAAAQLPHSELQAAARVKLADCQFEQKAYPLAATNYLMVLSGYPGMNAITERFFPQCYYQLIRIRVAETNFDAAGVLLGKMIETVPEDPLTEHAVLYFGQCLSEAGAGQQARSAFAKFNQLFPKSPLLPQVELAQARSFIIEKDWTNALTYYSGWITSHPGNPLRPEAYFARAWVYYQAGQETNAFNAFTNFVSEFRTNELAAQAQNWIADYYSDQENWLMAEQSYQAVFQSTNWPASPITYRAKLMAARTAFYHQGYGDARAYLTNVISDTHCPPEILPEAFFILGDVFIESKISDSTNALNNFVDAISAFSRITQQYPDDRLAPLAWGKIGDCHFQLAVQDPKSYDEATNAYARILDGKWAVIPPAAIDQAEVGTGLVLEKKAEIKAGKDQTLLWRAALDHYLNVVYERHPQAKQADPFWMKKAGLAAGRVAELLGDKEAAAKLYQRLADRLPSMKAAWDKKREALENGAL